jgi:hypothetical protein
VSGGGSSALDTESGGQYASAVPVVAITESQEIDAAGQLTNVFEITYTIPERPGTFTLTVPRSGDAVAAARAAIDELVSEVNAIYAL